MFKAITTLIFGVFTAIAVNAESVSSTYTSFDIVNSCEWIPSDVPEEESLGGEAKCVGLQGYPIYFSEYDLRHYIAFGTVDDPWEYIGGFANFNNVGDTIEWRTEGLRPFATIMRWYLHNYDADTDSNIEGQVLVITKVADPEIGNMNSCPVAYVDALANENANVLARQVADLAARAFRCGVDRPLYVGLKGEMSGLPSDIADEPIE